MLLEVVQQRLNTYIDISCENHYLLQELQQTDEGHMNTRAHDAVGQRTRNARPSCECKRATQTMQTLHEKPHAVVGEETGNTSRNVVHVAVLQGWRKQLQK